MHAVLGVLVLKKIVVSLLPPAVLMLNFSASFPAFPHQECKISHVYEKYRSTNYTFTFFLCCLVVLLFFFFCISLKPTGILFPI